MKQETINKIKKLANSYNPDFSLDVENFDDSYEYGVECGEQYVLEQLAEILEAE